MANQAEPYEDDADGCRDGEEDRESCVAVAGRPNFVVMKAPEARRALGDEARE